MIMPVGSVTSSPLIQRSLRRRRESVRRSVPLRLRRLAHRPVHDAVVLALLGSGALVLLQLLEPELPQELAVALQAFGRQRALRDGGCDRAPRLPVVAAVREPALGGELLHVGEGL